MTEEQAEYTHSEPNLTTTMSAEIGALALSLAKAQGEMEGAKKDSDNPYFKSKYADLAACWDACRAALSKNELAVVQTMKDSCDERVIIVTWLIHSSGQWMKGELPIRPVKNDPQAIGSAITYGRRYSLSAMVGIAQEDDDGNAASGKNKKQQPEDSLQNDDQRKIYEEIQTAFDKTTSLIGLKEAAKKYKAQAEKLDQVWKDKLNSFYEQHKKFIEETARNEQQGA